MLLSYKIFVVITRKYQKNFKKEFLSDMINSDKTTRQPKREHNPKGSRILYHYYWILIASGSRTGKINVLLDIIYAESGIAKIYLYARGPYEPKPRCQQSINAVKVLVVERSW